MTHPTMWALLAALVPQASGIAIFSSSSSAVAASAARSAEWRRCAEVEAEDQSFWSEEWSGLEAELEELRSVSMDPAKPATAPQHEHRKSPLAGLKLNLEPKSPADLVPALAMLKGLYEDGKERIVKLNAREKESKTKFEAKLADHNKRMLAIDTSFKNSSLSAEFHANETHDENRLWSYWERVRERQHRQFHTSLKIQHGTLEKVKQMIDMYEKTISGKADKAQVAKQLGVASGGVPDVVFLQKAGRELSSFCQEALEQVRSQRQALLQVPSDQD
eukprot:CAMPEP_0176273418 /NCGR_PEP_ID=MMETSP0121_2-20121125/46210_1 /TAXON_ID=160619 /ORGANISM="Kryptoperidinium foliaceum, Strain CCMP 1326" /LENGTH=275 /DNA_ID=CAMNT_0017613603 /DNA_START=69 /DNA_END=896 /DNA_ORIENTATION=+